jgi:hypothetical protein
MNYGMFSESGNLAVTGIVLFHKEIKSSWETVEQNLFDLSQVKGYEEATDTEVRECVYMALGFAQ